MTEGPRSPIKQDWLAATVEVAKTILRDFGKAVDSAFNTGVPSMAIGGLAATMGVILHDPAQIALGAGLGLLGLDRAKRYYRNNYGHGLSSGPK